MVERIQSGHYTVQEGETEQDRKNTKKTKEIRVVKGEVANENDSGALGQQFGFTNTKWYAYKLVRTEVTPRLDFSPTAPVSAFEKRFMEVRFMKEEFDSKTEAVEKAKDEWITSDLIR